MGSCFGRESESKSENKSQHKCDHKKECEDRYQNVLLKQKLLEDKVKILEEQNQNPKKMEQPQQIYQTNNYYQAPQQQEQQNPNQNNINNQQDQIQEQVKTIQPETSIPIVEKNAIVVYTSQEIVKKFLDIVKLQDEKNSNVIFQELQSVNVDFAVQQKLKKVIFIYHDIGRNHYQFSNMIGILSSKLNSINQNQVEFILMPIMLMNEVFKLQLTGIMKNAKVYSYYYRQYTQKNEIQIQFMEKSSNFYQKIDEIKKNFKQQTV